MRSDVICTCNTRDDWLTNQTNRVRVRGYATRDCHLQIQTTLLIDFGNGSNSKTTFDCMIGHDQLLIKLEALDS